MYRILPKSTSEKKINSNLNTCYFFFDVAFQSLALIKVKSIPDIAWLGALGKFIEKPIHSYGERHFKTRLKRQLWPRQILLFLVTYREHLRLVWYHCRFNTKIYEPCSPTPSFCSIRSDEFQHSCVSFSKNGVVSELTGSLLPFPFTQHYSTQYALQNAIRRSDTHAKPWRIHCFETDPDHHFDNSLTRRSFKRVKART